jgi:hypothetical protein
VVCGCGLRITVHGKVSGKADGNAGGECYPNPSAQIMTQGARTDPNSRGLTSTHARGLTLQRLIPQPNAAVTMKGIDQ